MLNWLRLPKLGSSKMTKLGSKAIIITIASIMFYHTALVASQVFTGTHGLTWEGVAFAMGVELAMIFYGQALSESPHWSYSISILICMVIAIFTSGYCQLYHILTTSDLITDKYIGMFQGAIDFLPIYLAFSLGVIMFSVTLSLIIYPYASEKAVIKSYTTDGVKTYTKDELEVVKLREAASTRSKRGNKGSEWSYPTKTGMIEVESPDELVERFESYVNKSYGKRFLEQQKEAMLNWLHNTDSGQYILTNTNFNLELE